MLLTKDQAQKALQNTILRLISTPLELELDYEYELLYTVELSYRYAFTHLLQDHKRSLRTLLYRCVNTWGLLEDREALLSDPYQAAFLSQELKWLWNLAIGYFDLVFDEYLSIYHR